MNCQKSLHAQDHRLAKSEEAFIASLYQQIGQLKVEVDFLKKKSGQYR
jgi:hypothetical protein